MPSIVRLHIYDVSQDEFIAKVNKYLHPLGTGAFHGGVEVYGSEWSYGFVESGSGVFPCPPMRCTIHRYRETIEMGITNLPMEAVEELIVQMKREWAGKDYDLLRKNCCIFSDEFCVRLGVGHIPAWVTNLAAAGATLSEGAIGAVSAGQLAAILAAAKAGEFDAKYNIRGTAQAKAKDVMEAAKDVDARFKIKETAVGISAHVREGAQRAVKEVTQGTPKGLEEDPFLQATDYVPRMPLTTRGGAARATTHVNQTIGSFISVCLGDRSWSRSPQACT
mmetsp:Transcript_90873/g.261865  ORF Transcript_90873/g.261865 Transcript_90873/m.261865 type:complete len:278 (-) Transcript_90873:158-991(-)